VAHLAPRGPGVPSLSPGTRCNVFFPHLLARRVSPTSAAALVFEGGPRGWTLQDTIPIRFSAGERRISRLRASSRTTAGRVESAGRNHRRSKSAACIPFGDPPRVAARISARPRVAPARNADFQSAAARRANSRFSVLTCARCRRDRGCRSAPLGLEGAARVRAAARGAEVMTAAEILLLLERRRSAREHVRDAPVEQRGRHLDRMAGHDAGVEALNQHEVGSYHGPLRPPRGRGCSSASRPGTRRR